MFNKVKQQLPPTSLAAPHQQSMFNIPYGQAVELNLIHDYVKQYYTAGEMKKKIPWQELMHSFFLFMVCILSSVREKNIYFVQWKENTDWKQLNIRNYCWMWKTLKCNNSYLMSPLQKYCYTGSFYS